VNELLAPLRRYLATRSTRERWLLVAAACVLGLMFIYGVVISPLEKSATETEARTSELEGQLVRALSIASEMRGLQGELVDVEGRIQPGAKTNLIALLRPGRDAKISQDQLESTSPSSRPRTSSTPRRAPRCGSREPRSRRRSTSCTGSRPRSRT
jgi:hypothetical protein